MPAPPAIDGSGCRGTVPPAPAVSGHAKPGSCTSWFPQAPSEPCEAQKPANRPRGRRAAQGERALVALSLLFGIYLTKPAPFCVLDEVDAPLDEKNARRFAEMLREFSKHTQFIVVTHNRATMEAADVLYGVTLDEDGTSKIVSMKFEEQAAG